MWQARLPGSSPGASLQWCPTPARVHALPFRPQVSVDVPRTAPNVPFFHEPVIQKSLERMLYIWGIRWVVRLFVDLQPSRRALLCAVASSSNTMSGAR